MIELFKKEEIMEEILMCKCGNDTWTVCNDKFICSKCNFIVPVNELAVYQLNGFIKDENSKFSNNECIGKGAGNE